MDTRTNIREHEGSELPDWVKAGSTVAVVNGHGLTQSVTFSEVTKVTPTQVVVGTTRFSIKKGLREMGRTDSWSRTPFLADPDSVEVRYAEQLRKVNNVRYRVFRNAEAFYKDSTVENANDVEESLALWRKLSTALDEVE